MINPRRRFLWDLRNGCDGRYRVFILATLGGSSRCEGGVKPKGLTDLRIFVGLSGSPKAERSFEMKAILNRAKSFLRSEDGPTATEYAVMLALIIIVCLAVITSLGTTVQGIFSTVDTALSGV